MADEFVGTQQFGEFTRRMEERFDHADELADQRFDSMNQRFLDVEKRMEQGFLYVDQRFEQTDRRLGDIQAEIRGLRENMQTESRSLRRTMLGLGIPVIAVLLSAIVTGLVKVLFFTS